MVFRSVIIAWLFFQPWLSISAWAQIPQVPSGRGPTASDELQRHNIALTKGALLRALRSSDADVRALAATKLAEDRAQDAIPQITEALAAEGVPTARLNIAFSLARLGEERGFAALKAACSDTAGSPGLRLRAAGYLLDVDDESCLESVIEIAYSTEEQDRIGGLSLLARFKRISNGNLTRVLDLALTSLTDSRSMVRFYASNVLGTLGDESAMPYLQKAIATETDDSVRSGMKDSTKKLQRRIAR